MKWWKTKCQWTYISEGWGWRDRRRAARCRLPRRTETPRRRRKVCRHHQSVPPPLGHLQNRFTTSVFMPEIFVRKKLARIACNMKKYLLPVIIYKKIWTSEWIVTVRYKLVFFARHLGNNSSFWTLNLVHPGQLHSGFRNDFIVIVDCEEVRIKLWRKYSSFHMPLGLHTNESEKRPVLTLQALTVKMH